MHLHDFNPWGNDESQESHREWTSLRDGDRPVPGPAKPQGVVVVNGDVVNECNVRHEDVDGKARSDCNWDDDFPEDPVEALCKVSATAGEAVAFDQGVFHVHCNVVMPVMCPQPWSCRKVVLTGPCRSPWVELFVSALGPDPVEG